MKQFFLIVTLLFLTGCATKEYVPTYVTLDNDRIKPCTIIPPPDKKRYVEGDETTRKLLLAQVYTAQLKELTLCNIRLNEAVNHNTRMSKKNTE